MEDCTHKSGTSSVAEPGSSQYNIGKTRSYTCDEALCSINGVYNPQVLGLSVVLGLSAMLNAALFSENVMLWEALMDEGSDCSLCLPVSLCDRACVRL